MKVLDWIKPIDASPLKALYYVAGDEDFGPIWDGSLYDTPYWIAEMELAEAKDLEGYPPICWRDDLGEDYDHKTGFIVTVKDE